MCLDAINNVPKEQQRGYGYKVVMASGVEDEFKGRWPFFARGRGGCGVKETHSLRNCVVWKIGRMYRVKHNRKAMADDRTCGVYAAGVHLYKKLGMARSEIGRYNECTVILVCYYTSGKYQDGKQLVAMRCTPVLALRNTEQRDIFSSLLKSHGPKGAIAVYQKRYAD